MRSCVLTRRPPAIGQLLYSTPAPMLACFAVVAAICTVVFCNSDSTRAQKVALNPKHCGVVMETRIINGRRAKKGSFPWLVRLMVEVEPGRRPATCGGSIITQWHVLTAAHCVLHNGKLFPSIEVVYGAVNTSSAKARRVAAESVAIHNRYEEDGFHNDIAVLKVAKPFQYGLLVRPICLMQDLKDLSWRKVVVAGWGVEKVNRPATDHLRYTTVKVLPQSKCKEKLGSHHYDENIMMCAYQLDTDACEGDSGSALMDREKKHFVQVGIVSFGVNCAGEIPGVYVPVSAFFRWITATLASPTRFTKISARKHFH